MSPKPTPISSGETESKPAVSWTKEEQSEALRRYGCEIIVSDGTWEQVNTREAPRDAKIVKYYLGGRMHYDLTRSGKDTKLFDCYWDKFRDGLVGWEWGNGLVNPKSWGYESPAAKSKKKK